MNPMLVQLFPILVLISVLVFDAFCLVDLVRADAVRYLSKMAWGFIICLFSPFGGITYLSLGRVR